jgi:hypothetical protein
MLLEIPAWPPIGDHETDCDSIRSDVTQFRQDDGDLVWSDQTGTADTQSAQSV